MKPEDYMRQSVFTIEEYYIKCCSFLDKINGKGYSEKHPELVGQLVIACTNDFNTALLQKKY